MIVLPDVTQRDEFAAWRRTPNAWRDIAAGIARAEGIRPTVLSAFATGTNLVVDLDSAVILKLFPPFHRDQFLSERASLRILDGALSVPIPRLLGEGALEGWPYLLIGRVEGRLGSTVWPHLTEADKVAVLRDVGRTIRDVQAVAPGDLFDFLPPWPQMLAQQIAQCASRHRRLGLAPRFLAELDILLEAAPASIPTATPPVILTGEWIPENLMLAERDGRWRLAAVFDFGDVMTGWREYDLLGPSTFMACGVPGRLSGLIEGYGARPEDLDASMRRRLLTLMMLHRASDLRNLRIEDWATRAETLFELEAIIWPAL